VDQHIISYDLARGLHIISVIAWIAGMLMLPRFYGAITELAPNDPATPVLLKAAQNIRTIILTPSLVLAWAFGIFLFFTYFAPDWEAPAERLEYVPSWFWVKVTLALALTGYHGLLSVEGKRLARGERRHSRSFWGVMSVVPFFVAVVIVLLATVEP
jgi:protoporphyrinogen IX oxidase